MAGIYSIYSTKAKGKTEGPDVHILTAGTNVDNFMGSLPDEGVILASKPSPSANFDTTDKWEAWMKSLDPAVALSLTWDNATSMSIQSFAVNFKPSFSTATLRFSSDTTSLNNAFGPPAQLGGAAADAKIPVPGLRSDGDILYYGLDTTGMATVSTTVADLFKFVDDAASASVLPGPLAAASVSLDPTKALAQRNALWVRPSFGFETTARFSFKLDLYDKLLSYLTADSALPGLSLPTVSVVCKHVLTQSTTVKGIEPAATGSVTFFATGSITAPDKSVAELSTSVEFTSGQVELTMLLTKPDSLDVLLKWLVGLSGVDAGLQKTVNDLLKQGDVFPKINLRRLRVTLDNTDPNNLKLSTFSIDIEAQADFGNASGSSSIVTFLVNYTWNRSIGSLGILTASFWPGEDAIDDTSPYYEPWTTLVPLNNATAKTIDLATIIKGNNIGNIPDTVPSQITRAIVSISSDSFSIGATIDADKPTAGSVPLPYLGEISIDASYSWGKESAFVLSVGIMAGLLPSAASNHQEAASLVGSLDYNSSTGIWELKADLEGLWLSSLFHFIDSSSENQVVPLLDSIEINTLSVDYTYTKGVGSLCIIHGLLYIGGLQLVLDFSYSKAWSFTAVLKPKVGTPTTLGQIVKSIIGDAAADIPDFAGSMEISGDDQFKITVAKGDAAAKTSLAGTSVVPAAEPPSDADVPFVFFAEFVLKPLDFAFLQYRDSSWASSVASKRLLKIALTELPKIEVPVVGNVTQPFDEMYYLWLQDNSKKNKGDLAGLTRAEKKITDKYIKLEVKDTIKTKGDDVVIVQAGSHFAIVVKDSSGKPQCLLDYNFAKPQQDKQPESTTTRSITATPAAAGDDKSSPANTGDGSTAEAPLKKVQGPITISNVGLKYANGTLSVKLDADLVLGPLGFSLEGFALNFKITTLNDPLSWGISPSLEGLAVVFDKKPLTIAGIIRHGNDGNLNYYAGGLIVGFVPYQFMAAGFYGTTLDNSGKEFTSVFVFAKLNGPLITLEFATISGITGGIGYNSSVRYPTAAEITQYPFVAADALGGGEGSNALDALKKLVTPTSGQGWFSPQNNTYWAAAGLKVDALEMLAIDAVVVVQFGENTKLGIFAVATADLPTAAAPKKFAHVELGLAITVDFGYGVLRTDGQLSPNSYILAPDCHLTGGFGFCYWFDAPHADQSLVGQFVFTVGGYHPAFDIPTNYPNPPRLGISWNLGSELSITGESYFAVTPKVCMGGGRLHAQFSAGPIRAWFDAFANFLINYRPFHFIAEGGIAVGVAFELDLLFIHKSISAEISATLTLWGPPLAGRVHVDFWVTSFDINFGDSDSGQKRVTLAEFFALVQQSNQQTGKGNNAHVFLALTGLMNGNDHAQKEPRAPWLVRGGTLSFAINCTMAIDSASFSSGDPITYTDHSIFSKPMKIKTPLKSPLIVKTYEDTKEQDVAWRREANIKSLPNGLWAEYNAADDPSGGNNNVPSLLTNDKTSTPLMAGVTLRAPPPILSPDRLPRFNITDASLLDIDAKRKFPKGDPAAGDFRPVPPLTGPEPYPTKPQFDAVAKAWANPDWETSKTPPVTGASFVGQWAAALGWSDPTGLAGVAAMPRKLKAQFSNLYVAAPLLTA